ncbi:maleylpyruvate isomerase family mycothiol-dependent enzyme [Nocardioides sp. TF02-7]|uniref:maleylpyruvate isomerase family mycothiol-dependent enzyme n=1 Tax=Nocardioides sp. TF02-7 TaxID=2917724 RepID=UPI001F06C569|nr:maleylpyruvate isomerase family mycothiol-dependent enzyme [Nocardioides sp. TF02-7]UMG92082.1 maleylpyruvate isomerase family mycothiol-dependent enzyme [Nocardioides sp. TF02-7]
MRSGWAEARDAYRAAAERFLATVRLVGDRWDEPGLGEWDVRALVGHTTRSFLTVEEYAATPADAIRVDSPVEYYRAARAIAAGPGVAQRGRDAGAALGDDPVAAVTAIAERVLPVLDRHDGTEVVQTIVGGMRFADYLPTRVFELAVHTADLAVALGEPVDVPPAAAEMALSIVAGLAVHDGRAGDLLLAATGRSGLPVGFSVL